MIDKSLRSRYQWGGPGGKSPGGGGRGGSGGGAGAGRGRDPAPAPAPSPHRDPEPAARVEPRVSPVQSVAMTGGTGLAGMTQTQAANVMAASEVVNRDQTGGVTLGTGMTGIPSRPGMLGDIGESMNYMGGSMPANLGDIGGSMDDLGPGPITRGGGPDVIPEFVPRKTTTVTGGVPFVEDPIQKIVYEPREGPARTYDPRTDPNALLQRDSGIMGTVKDKSIQMAKNFSKQKAMKALGLGALNPFLGIGSWLLGKFAPGIKTKFASKFDTQEEATKELVSRDTRDGDGQQITGGENVISENIKKFAGHDLTVNAQDEYLRRRNMVQGILDQGSYQGKELTEQQRNSLLNYIKQISKFLVDPMEVAYGGRIDKALGGRSRDIG